MQRKSISRFRRDVELLRHQSSYSKYTPAEQKARKRIRSLGKLINKELLDLKKYPQIRSFSKELLFEKLEDFNMINKQKGTVKVNIPTNLSEIDYRIIEQSFQRFRSSRSSTAKGLRKLIRNQRANLLESTGDKEFVASLTDKEIMDFNRMYSDNSFEVLSRVISSDLIKTISEDSARFGYDVDQFQAVMEMFIQQTPDEELKRAIFNLYNRYVRKIQKK